jgi:hypothetical protein
VHARLCPAGGRGGDDGDGGDGDGGDGDGGQRPSVRKRTAGVHKKTSRR